MTRTQAQEENVPVRHTFLLRNSLQQGVQTLKSLQRLKRSQEKVHGKSPVKVSKYNPTMSAQEAFGKQITEDQENTLEKLSLHACPAAVPLTTPLVLPLSETEHWALICTQV